MAVKERTYFLKMEQTAVPETYSKPGKIHTILKLLRVKQWVKNSFVLVPLLIQFHPPEIEQVAVALIGCFLFCGISSSVYIFNDLMDVKEDRAHPYKRFRPIASGAVSKASAIAISVSLCAATLATGYIFDISCGIILTLYILLNLMYSLKLRKFMLVDLFVISMGFVLRVLLGLDMLKTAWYTTNYICFLLFIMFGTLFISIGKRKGEMMLLYHDGKKCRSSICGLSLEDFNQIICVFMACTILSYVLFLIETNITISYLTIPFVLYGISRYQLISKNADMIGSPELIMLNDRPIILCILLWGAFFLCINVFHASII
jgi:4-hydroxybenzoate polyprenyltransferase